MVLSKKPPIIDFHVHAAIYDFYSEQFIEGLSATTIQDSEASIKKVYHKFARKLLSDINCSQLIQEMDKNNVELSVLLIIDLFPLGEQGDEQIERVFNAHKCIQDQYPKRFKTFAGINPMRGRKALELLNWGLRDLDFSGLKLYPPCGFDLNHPVLPDMFSMCSCYNVPVLIHSGDSFLGKYDELKARRHLENAIRTFPHTKFVIAHGMNFFFEQNIELCQKYGNAFMDISGCQKLMNDFFEFTRLLSSIFNHIEDKALFGSDRPLFNLECPQNTLISKLDIALAQIDGDAAALWRNNAANLLCI